MKKICLLYGGDTTESEVSFHSSRSFLSVLKALGFDVYELEFSEKFISEVQAINPDIVLNSMHGKYGEDGVVPTILNFLHIPYTHSGRKASILGMDKITTKEIAKNLGIPTIPYHIATKKQLLEGDFKRFPKSFIKPFAEGSTIGCVKLFSESMKSEDKEIIKKVEDDIFIIEEFFQGVEISAGVLNGKSIGSVEIAPKSGYYDYTSKYTKGATDYFLPPRISDSVRKKIEEAALAVHNTIGAKTVSRSDFLVNGEDFRFLEINTHPGCTTTSLIPKMALSKGIAFEKIVKILLEDASFEPY